jgi:hypothetical protein
MFPAKAQTPVDTLMKKLQAVGRLGKHSKKLAAVAAYEDAHTEARVNEFCRSLGRQLGEQCEIIQQMWLFNELRIPQLRAIAAKEASRADLVIISAHHAQSFPAEVKDWIELSLGQKGGRPGVLLALFDPVYQGDSTALQAYLKEVSRRGKKEFLVQSEEMPDKD